MELVYLPTNLPSKSTIINVGLGGGFKYFLCSPLLGEIIHIFQRVETTNQRQTYYFEGRFWEIGSEDILFNGSMESLMILDSYHNC